MTVEKWPRDQWLDAIWEDEELKPNERVIAYVYARFAGRTETAWASYPVIMRRTGMRSKRSIAAAMAVLVEKGWLKLEQAPRQHYSGVYRLTCPQQTHIATTEPSASGSDMERLRVEPDPAVAIWHPAVANLHASGSNSGAPDLRTALQVEISEARENERDPSGARSARSPDNPHTFLEDGHGKCLCGLGRKDQVHRVATEKKAKRQPRVRLCQSCGKPLDRALAEDVHPTCEPTGANK